MVQLVYRIVRHDGGWAYLAGETYSETFPTRDLARKAASLAVAEQRAPEPATASEIVYEDTAGRWHEEHSDGNDRPDSKVVG